MFPSTPIRVSPVFRWHVVKEGLAIREVHVRKWERNSEGYRISFGFDGEQTTIVGRKHGDRLLVPATRQFDVEDSFPLSNPAMFMNFAQLECSESIVLAFAAKYGYLTAVAESRRSYEPEDDDADYEDDSSFFGESVDEWFTQIRLMRLAVELWEIGRGAGLRKRLGDTAILHKEILSEQYYGTRLRPQVESMRTPKEAGALAHSIALENINGGNFAPGLRWSFQEVLPHNRHVLEITPEVFGVGLWLQFATAMAAAVRVFRMRRLLRRGEHSP
jgi:hypothetical protein